MKIAIVAPSPIPFTMGGVEYVIVGMANALLDNTNHQVEIIKIPVKEDSFWSLINSYKKFYDLKLSHFDMVITTKYPAWMVRHNNHYCYMHHRLRGLYDTYKFFNLPDTTDRNDSNINKILDIIRNTGYGNEGYLFSELEKLQEIQNQINDSYFEFPGPFIKEIITYLDNSSLSSSNIKKFFCISETVKNRTEYFPINVEPIIIYPPSNKQSFSNKDYKHIFTMSRLDSPKRIHLLISAMKYVKSSIKLYIAGTGPEEYKLKEMAKTDNRIVFLGFITDDEAKEYYSNSIFTPYFPQDEDYGLITVESLMAGKPVLTCKDAGGPTEFVINNSTGYIAEANAKDIAKHIDKFCNMSLEQLEKMSQECINMVKTITWQSLIHKLIGNSEITISPQLCKRKKILVISNFNVYPPQNGGQYRIFNLYKQLSIFFDIEILSISNESECTLSISNSFIETRIKKSDRHASEEWNIEKHIGVPITDVGMISLIEYTPKYKEEFDKKVLLCDYVVFSHPYLFNILDIDISAKIIYEAQDVEYNIKKAIFNNANKYSRDLLAQVYNIEKKLCEKADLIIACSNEDIKTLSSLYTINIEKFNVVPNGVDTKSSIFFSLEQRLRLKNQLGLQNDKIVMFSGSWHKPNLDACELIFNMAQKTPEIKYILIGSQCQYFDGKEVPNNVVLQGFVSDEEKIKLYNITDIAINPMISGSGTNLKMFDYMSSGIPVLSTDFGARGIDNRDIIQICSIDTFHEAIVQFKLIDSGDKVEKARDYVVKNFDWESIAVELKEALCNKLI